MKLSLTAIFCMSAFFATAQQQEHFTLLFDFNSTMISKQSRGAKDSLLQMLKENAVKNVTVSGHTDTKGGGESNLALAYDRAMYVKEMIISTLPQNTEVQVKSYGKETPVSVADDKQYLNRRVEVTFTRMNDAAIKEVQLLESFVSDVEEQHFSVNLDDTVHIKAKGGTSLKISPGSIQTKSGKIATGVGDIIIKEYYSPGDIISAGINSMSPKGLLQSGGMLSFSIVQHGDTMATKTKKDVLIKMPMLDNSLTEMNVFTSAQHPDSSTWATSGQAFNLSASYWDLPRNNKRFKDISFRTDFVYSVMPVGRTYSDELTVRRDGPVIWDFTPDQEKEYVKKPQSKSFQLSVTKTDSVTLRVHVFLDYRKKANRTFGSKNFDTTFNAKYMRAEYEGLVGDVSWVNCDRFYDYKNKTDFYVTTPGYEGMGVMAYFTSIRSFMPMRFNGNSYELNKVPAGLPVVFVGLGKKDGQIYFGKVKTFTKKGEKNELLMTKLSEDELKKKMKEL